jgi:predicted metal-dependent hydrolase
VDEPTSDLVVRRPSFGIDETVPFQWQPANPAFGLFGNAFTFVVIAFERYIVAVMRQALERIDDPRVAAEAEAFLRQEAQHARAHRAHARAMIAHHPGLADTLDAVSASYDEVLDAHDLEFHLAYIADLEATFTPLFKMVFDNRGPLFTGGDERVGTLLIWHFVEEIEHRSSALMIQSHLTPDRWARIRLAPTVFRHVSGIYEQVVDGIVAHVGEEECGIDPATGTPVEMWRSEVRARLPRRGPRPSSMLGHVPGRDLRTMVRHLATSQLPRHRPADEPLPAWIDRWHAAYDAGADISSYAAIDL